MVRPLVGVLLAGLAAASLPVLAGAVIRAGITDAGPGRRLAAVRGQGRAGTRTYLDFDPDGFASHPGRLSMRAASGGDLVVLGPPDIGTVARRTVERGDASLIVREGEGRLSGHLGQTPADFGFSFEDAMIGGLPAWVIQAPEGSDTWVIHVHGLGSSRSQCLRGVAAFSALGYTSLLASYRTSLDLSPNPGRSHLGASEWKDIEAARQFAVGRGARRLLFVGWSLGASIVLRTIDQAPAGSTAGALLVSPALDWPGIITARLQAAGCPGFLARRLPHTVNLVRPRGEPAIRWKDMPSTHMTKHPRVPIMILHGTEDQSVPVELSRTCAGGPGQPVGFVEFEGAHHTLEWNSAPQLWNESVQAWCRRLDLLEHVGSINPVSEAE